MTHWQHPRFHAYFPAGNSFPSILADMLSGAIGCVGFSWVQCQYSHSVDAVVASHHYLSLSPCPGGCSVLHRAGDHRAGLAGQNDR